MEVEAENEELDVVHHHQQDDTKTMHNYYKKYIALKKRCESIHLVNERMVNRIYYVKKTIRKLSWERRALIATLDEYGDDCRNAPLMIAVEEDMPFTALSSSDLGGEFSDVPLSAPPKKQSFSPPLSLPPSSSPTTAPAKPPASTPAARKKKRRDDKPEKEKDPNAPKKPANAYLMFCQQERAPVQEEHQNLDKDDISHQDLTKELAKRWNELNPEQKQAYYDMYEKDKLRYEREMQAYNSLQSAINVTTASIAKPDTKPIIVENTIATVALSVPAAMAPKIKQEKVFESAYSRIKFERQEVAKLKMERLETPKPQPPPDDYDPYNFDDEESKRS